MTASAVANLDAEMPRWPPDARERLEQAALELFSRQGYEQTTVAQIADRAGLKERSFYRYYADKREVLSAGGEELAGALVTAVAATRDDLGPLETLLGALPAAAAVMHTREFVRQLRDVVGASPALAERHLIKLAAISDALTGALCDRGVDRPTAELCVTIGMGVLNQATERWVNEEVDFTDAVHDISTRLIDLIGTAHAGATAQAVGPGSVDV